MTSYDDEVGLCNLPLGSQYPKNGKSLFISFLCTIFKKERFI